MAEINTRINAVVVESGLTKTAVAKRIGISQAHVSRLCANGTPSDRTIMDICREFNVSEKWLRTGEGEMHAPQALADEVASYLGRLMADRPEDNLQREVIAMLSRGTPEFWEGLGKMLDEWTALWSEIQQEKNKENL